DLALAGREVGEEGPQVLALDGGDRGLERRLRRRVLEQVAELVVPVLADGGRQRDEVGRRLEGGLDLVERDAGLLGQLLGGGLAPQRLEQAGRGLRQRGQRVHEVRRQPDRAPLVGDAPADRL